MLTVWVLIVLLGLGFSWRIKSQKTFNRCENEFSVLLEKNTPMCYNDTLLVFDPKTWTSPPDGGLKSTINFDSEERAKYPWTNSSDEQCHQHSIRFGAKGSLPMRALVSFPGSGNTWLR